MKLYDSSWWRKLASRLSLTNEKRAKNLDAIWYQVYDYVEKIYPMMWVKDLYMDADANLFAIIKDDNQMYKAMVTLESDGMVMVGDLEPVTQEFMPVQRNAATRTHILTNNDNQVGWLSISATSTVNRDGAIDSTKLFDSFVEFADDTGFMPVRNFYHVLDENFVTGQTLVIARAGNCYVTSGVYHDVPLAHAEIRALQSEPNYWGESIGFYPFTPPKVLEYRDMAIPVYENGFNFEVSVLPEAEAASWFTQPLLLNDDDIRRNSMNGLNPKQIAAFARIWNITEEEAKRAIETQAGKVNEAIDANGLLTRKNETQESQEPVVTNDNEEGLQQTLNGGDADDTINQLAEVIGTQMRTLSETFTSNLREFQDNQQALMKQVNDALGSFDNRLQKFEQQKEIQAQQRQDAPSKHFNLSGFSPIHQRNVMTADAYNNGMVGEPLQQQELQAESTIKKLDSM